MTSKSILGCALLMGALGSSMAQAHVWNLKGLRNVVIEFTQINSQPIPPATLRQWDAEIESKLKGVGLTLASPQDARATLEITLKRIKGTASEWIEVELQVREDVQTSSRKTSSKAPAITYADDAYLESTKSMDDKEVHDTVLNELVTKFVKDYMNQNSK